MEQMPHHREGIQEQLDKAYDEGHRDNEAINEERKKEYFEKMKSLNERYKIVSYHGDKPFTVEKIKELARSNAYCEQVSVNEGDVFCPVCSWRERNNKENPYWKDPSSENGKFLAEIMNTNL